jgi:hypothetical protein
MYVRGPFSVEGYEQTISHRYTTAAEPDRVVTVFNRASDFVKAEMAAGDSIYAFEFLSGSQENFWGFSGYAVARGDCVIHVDVTEYLN